MVLALNLVPFAGIAFLWFIGVVRDRLGTSEDRFFATVFFGSGILFLAMFFAAAAVAGAMILVLDASPKLMVESGAYAFGRAISAQIMNVFALKMAGVFMISTATLAMRTHILPRWITLPGYALAALLLLSSRFADWLPLAFPLWVLVLSLYILIENLRGTNRPRQFKPRGRRGAHPPMLSISKGWNRLPACSKPHRQDACATNMNSGCFRFDINLV